ncbi:hypothetical protein HG531_009277 [Fusarium graminearum]|nr:hypothetical protein HG531_009277 [Fusarium graminearum]
MEPKDGAETESKPGNRCRRGDGEDGIEDGDGVGNDKDNDPVQGHADDPNAPRLDTSVGDLCDRKPWLWRKHMAKRVRDDGDDDEADGTHGVVAKGVERDRQGYTGRSASHHNLDHQPDTSHDLQRSTTNDSTHVNDINHVRIFSVELEEFVGSIGRKTTETNDGNDAGDDTEDLETTGEGQNTKADLVGDEDKDGVPFTEGSVILAALVEDILDRLV